MRFLTILIIISAVIFASNQNFISDDKIKAEVSMAVAQETRQVVDLEERLRDQVVKQEAFIRLLVKKGIFSTEEFSEMVRVVGKEVKPMSIRLPTPVEGR